MKILAVILSGAAVIAFGIFFLLSLNLELNQVSVVALLSSGLFTSLSTLSVLVALQDKTK